MNRTVITRVTETDFQTEDGRTVPHPVPFPKDEVPSVEEFQKCYDHWHAVFDTEGLLNDDGWHISDPLTPDIDLNEVRERRFEEPDVKE